MLLVLLGVAARGHGQASAPSAIAFSTQGQHEVARGTLQSNVLVLAVDADGDGHLYLGAADERWQLLEHERLEGAWGLWPHDVDGDGVEEVLVALRKRAKFDPVLENRLHVYSLDGRRCVPEWRGTRLAGRFDDLHVDPERPGVILAWERVAHGEHRVARYRWRAFGFALEAELWRGRGSAPRRWRGTFPTLANARRGTR